MWPHLCSVRPAWNTEGISLHLKRNFFFQIDVSRFWILHSCRLYSILIPSISTDILFLPPPGLFCSFRVVKRIAWGPFYSRLGPVDDWCLHLRGCICQWKCLDWSLPSCLVFRKTGWVFQDYWPGSLFPWSCFVSVLRFHAPGISYGLFLPLSELAHCVWGSPGPGHWLSPTWFHRLLQLSILRFFARATSSLCIHLSLDITVAPNLSYCEQCCSECCASRLLFNYSLSRYRSNLGFPGLVVKVFGRFSVDWFFLHFISCFYGQCVKGGPFPSRHCPGDTLSTFLKMALLAYCLEDVMKLFSKNVGWEGISMSFV